MLKGGKLRKLLFFMAVMSISSVFAQGLTSDKPPIFIGFDGAFGQKTNTAAKAIESGINVAIAEINAAGGVLNGRPLKLITTDNKGVTARGKDNFIELAQNKDMVAVMGGKYSPISVETLPEAHRLKMPLISVWGSADQITDHSYRPSYSFRVSLKDDWGVEGMMKRISQKYRAKKACAFLPNTAWGRSADNVIKAKSADFGLSFTVIRWYNWGDASLKMPYKECQEAGGQAILFVGNEKEGAILIKEVANLPQSQRLPIVSHWGISGGVIHELVGSDLDKVELDVVQTFTFIGNNRPKAKFLGEQVMKSSNLKNTTEIQSPVGVAQAYDATHLVALAINKAQSTDREKIRNALESSIEFVGAIRNYKPAFTRDRHDALSADNLLFVTIKPDGTLIPAK